MWLDRYWISSTVLAAQLLVAGCVDVLPATPDPIDRDQNGASEDGGGNDASITGGGGDDASPTTGGGGMDGGPSTNNGGGNGGGSFDGGFPPAPDGGGGADDAAAGDATLPNALDCETYCETIQAACTGDNSQYDTLQECLAMCDDMPEGARDDASGDSLGCRLYHAQNAMKQARPDVHCPHAGPTGGGICGTRCEALCDRASKLCTDDRGYPEAYASREDCMIICEPNPDTGLGGYAVDKTKELPASGNTVNCRVYHLRNAYTRLDERDQENDSAGVHCKHVGKVSPTCL